MTPEIQELYRHAQAAREKSYSPYSGCKVGAAIKLQNGAIYSGCNVENTSYGATVCAERVAVQKAVSEAGPISIQEVMVVTEASPPWPPCGMCRQVIAEFGSNVTLHLANLKGEIQTRSLAELFPYSFNPSHLDKVSKK